ncbi:hypothetical protein RUA8715_02457 [Ruegeria arenilitoris]|uniref:Uncharacterized protein n=1 Tax=Ruegeria arenilitoris TaxID=1173585 RepID=A0A238KP14_9RHOB|nr:hypothetical protein RUA8715_02457 [Ruegeria arenilitoris]
MACVRNTQLETLHAGLTPVSQTGDSSDVVVVDAAGRRIPWSEVSRISDDEMRALMREIVDRLYTFYLRIDDPAFRAEIDRWAAMTAKWGAPKPDPVLSAIPAETPERG